MIEIIDLDLDDARWDRALDVLCELRTELTPDGLRAAYGDQSAQGAHFLAAFDSDDCLGVAGWRIVATTNVGRKLYVDDLVTTARRRSTGVGRLMLDELERRAREAGCTTLELDSSVVRHSAHRFYLRERMDIASHHFVKRL